MIKVLLNNEEVVCKNNLQIKEKMLSTSSTILKNCYPISWEEDKDYASKYYFPPDYSKCKIIDELYHPEIIGTRVSGTYLNINYDNTLNWDFEQLKGNTYQQTYTGKNLLKNTSTNSGDNNYWSEYSTYNQITGELTRSTTATTESFITHRINGIRNSTKYTISFMAKSNGKVKNMDIYFFNRQTQGICSTRNITLTTTYQKYTFTFTTNSSTDYSTNSVVRIDNNGSTESGTTATLTIKDVMLVEGEDTNFEPYVGGTASPNPSYPQPIENVTGLQKVNVCGKNLFDKSTIIEGKYIDASGNLANDNNNFVGDYIPIDNTKNYYISATIGNAKRIAYYNNSKTFISREVLTATGGALTIPNNIRYVRLSCYNSDLNTLQLEQNNQATSYESYTGNTYELNLGKNLLNITSFTNGTVTTDNLNDRARGNNELFLNEGTYTFSTNLDLDTYKYYVTITPTVAPNNTIKYNSGWITTSSCTFTITSDTKGYFTFNIGRKDNANFSYTDIDDFNYQVERGSSSTSYSPYFTPIELNKIGDYQDSIKKSTGKNLFDKDNVENNKVISSDGTIIDNNGYIVGDYIEVKPNTQYAISFKYISGNDVVFRIGCYNNNKTFISRETNSSGANYIFTTPNNTQYIRISYQIAGFKNVQIELGSSSSSYEPYGEVWYIEKKIGKVNFGDITWNSASHYNPNYRRYYTTTIPNVKYVSSNTQLGVGLAENYTIHTGNGMGGSGAENCFAIDVSMVQAVDKTTPSGLFYYALNIPEYITITNEEILSQLNILENSNLLNGINNIIISSENLSSIIQIYYNYRNEYTSQDLLFCGLAKNTGNVSLNPREFHGVDLQILDFKDLLSTGETLNYVITNKTIKEAIEQVINSVADYGFVVGDINILNPNDTINAYSTLNKTAYDVFQYIADVTQSRWFTRMVDENTIAIDFYDPSLMPEGLEIESTKIFYETYDIEDISFNYSTKDYRNKQIMTSDEVIANITQTETIIADGYAKTFMCQNKIGVITSITVDGVSKSFITKSQDESGASGDFVYQPGENVFVSNITISAGSSIVITYYAIVRGREIILDSNEKSRIENQIGRNGTVSRYENRNDTTSSLELQSIGQSYLKYKGSAEITLKVVTSQNLWNIGQIVHYNAPLEELTKDYMVKTKTTDFYITNNIIFYTYELTSNFNCEDAVNYFDNQRAKSQGNIGEGEYITRAIDIENTALILFYDTNIEEVQISNPTSLDFKLDGALI